MEGKLKEKTSHEASAGTIQKLSREQPLAVLAASTPFGCCDNAKKSRGHLVSLLVYAAGQETWKITWGSGKINTAFQRLSKTRHLGCGQTQG